MERNVAIVLAAGQGSRMGTTQKKQYLLLDGKPMLYYSLQAFEQSEIITDIIIVVGQGEEEYVQKEMVDAYSFHKVRGITTGGKERYHSVYAGICAATHYMQTCEEKDNLKKDHHNQNRKKTEEHVDQFPDASASESQICYIWIHDGARPFVTEEILQRVQKTVTQTQACVVGMPVKDTIKIADEEGNIAITPNRNLVWMIQTPQVFEYELVRDAYEQLIRDEVQVLERGIVVTDDAMVVETFTNHKVRLVEGDYKNIKITTPEDLLIAQNFLKD